MFSKNSIQDCLCRVQVIARQLKRGTKQEMNIERRTSNIERRRMKSFCSVDFYKNDTPEAYHSSTLDVRCSTLDGDCLFGLNVYFYQFIKIGFAYLIAGLMIRPQVVNQSEKGFTLVEVMVAIVVLSIGFFAVGSMQIAAVTTNSSANHITEATNLAQSRLEELMALEYSRISTDPDLIDDAATAGGSESYTDSNGNGLRDEKEPYADSNNNGVWDAAHVDPNPPPGYAITWSVLDNTAGSPEKYIRVYVTRHDNKRTIMLSCIKSRE